VAGFGVPVIGGVVALSVTGTVFGAAPHAAPVVPHAVCEAVAVAGVAGLGAPVPGGVVVSAAGWADLGAPEGFAGAALVVGAGRAAGAGVPAGVEVVDAAALA
jgi:hypothetical protein